MQYKLWTITPLLLYWAQHTVARPATNATADAERGLLGGSYGTLNKMVPYGLDIESIEHSEQPIKTHEFMYGINFALGNLAILDGDDIIDRQANYHNPNWPRTACVSYHPLVATTHTQLAAALYLVASIKMRRSGLKAAMSFDIIYHNIILGHGYVGLCDTTSIVARSTTDGAGFLSDNKTDSAAGLQGKVPDMKDLLTNVSLKSSERTLTFGYKSNGLKLGPYPAYVILAEYFLGLSRLHKHRSIDDTFKLEWRRTQVLGTAVSVAQGIRPAAVLLPEDAVHAAAYMTALLYSSQDFKECSVTIDKPTEFGLAQAGILSLRRPSTA